MPANAEPSPAPYPDIDAAHGRVPATGRFAAGNPGGPGRPRRAIEADYLAALSEAVPLDRWRKIVERAVTDAEQGDSKARGWLGSYLAGRPGGNALRQIAVNEAAGIDPLAESVRLQRLLKSVNPFVDDDLDLDDDDLDDDDLDDDDSAGRNTP